MISKLLRGEEVAEILNISKAFAYRLMAEGQIPTIKMGRAVRVRPEELDRFIQESRPKSHYLSITDGFMLAHPRISKI